MNVVISRDIKKLGQLSQVVVVFNDFLGVNNLLFSDHISTVFL